MNIKQLSAAEKARLIVGSAIAAIQKVSIKEAEQVTEADLNTLASDLNRIFDLIEESRGTLQ